MDVHGWKRRRWRHGEHWEQPVRVPWAEPSARCTMLFEEVAIALLQGMTIVAGTTQIEIRWDELD